jgi:hypothetical protein
MAPYAIPIGFIAIYYRLVENYLAILAPISREALVARYQNLDWVNIRAAGERIAKVYIE